MEPDRLSRDVEQFKRSPIAFVASLLSIAAVIWFAMNWAYGQRIDGLTAENERLRSELARMEEAAKTVAIDSDGQRGLTRGQLATLQTHIKLPTGVVQTIGIQVTNTAFNGAKLGEQLRRAFREAGWDVQEGMTINWGDPPREGLILGVSDTQKPGNRERQLITAFDLANIPYQLRKVDYTFEGLIPSTAIVITARID